MTKNQDFMMFERRVNAWNISRRQTHLTGTFSLVSNQISRTVTNIPGEDVESELKLIDVAVSGGGAALA